MQRRRHEVRDHEDEHPTTSTTAVCRPNDRVGVEVRGRGESRLPSSSCPRLFSISMHLVVIVSRRTLRAALARTSRASLNRRRIDSFEHFELDCSDQTRIDQVSDDDSIWGDFSC